MFQLFFGSDSGKARESLSAATEKLVQKGGVLTRITDAHSLQDLDAALRGGGLFSETPVVVFEGIVSGENEALSARLLSVLKDIADSDEHFFLLEGALDASTRKLLEKHAESSQRFDLEKKEERSTIFGLSDAFRRGDKKALWLGYHRELQKGSAPEAIHGVLFWSAKEQVMRASNRDEKIRAQRSLATLAELPHAARRAGFDFEYALEQFLLTPLR